MMFFKRKILVCLITVLACLLVPSWYEAISRCAPIDRAKVPGDFRIFAHYHPDVWSHWKAWKTTVNADGEVAQEVQDMRTGKWASNRRQPLTEQGLTDLAIKVKECDFFGLQKGYSARATDGPNLVLDITLGGRSKEVNIILPPYQKDEDEVERFLALFSELVRKVPSPNTGGKGNPDQP